MSRVKSATVDPFYDQPEDDRMPVLNGKSGEIMKLLPLAKMHRVSRKKFQALCSEGIQIEVSRTSTNRMFGVRSSISLTLPVYVVAV